MPQKTTCSRRRARTIAWLSRTAAHVICALAALSTLLVGVSALAQDAATQKAVPAELNPTDVQTRSDEVQSAPDLDDPTKQKLTQSYATALTYLRQAAALKQQADDYSRRRQEAPSALEEVRRKLENPPSNPSVDPELPLAKLDQSITEKEAQLDAEENALKAWTNETKNRAELRLAAPKAAVAATVRLDEIDDQLSGPDLEGEGQRQALARRTLLTAERQKVAAESEKVRQELLSYEATDELLPLEQDAATAQKNRTLAHLTELRKLADSKRKAEAEESAARAKDALRQAASAHAVVKTIAQENVNFTDRRTELVARNQTLRVDVEADLRRLEQLTSDLARMQQRAELRGLDDGALLRKKGDGLPDPRQLRRSSDSLRTEMADAELELLDAQDQRTALADIEKLVKVAIDNLGDETPLAERDSIEIALRDHLASKQVNLEALINSYRAYVLALDNLATARDELAVKSHENGAFIAERVLWVRSAEPLGLATLEAAAEPLRAFTDPVEWAAIVQAIGDDFLARPLLYIVPLAVVLAVLRMPSRLRRRLREMGRAAARGSTDTFRPTVEAVFYTAALSAIWPAAMGILAWRLLGATERMLPEALAYGLLATALVYLPLETLRQVCRPQGLGDAHFGWSARGLMLLRRSLLRLMLVGLPLVFVIAAVHSQNNEVWKDSLGRLAFLAVMIVVAFFLWRILRPVGGILYESMAQNPGAWLDRFRLLWYPLAIGAPLALAGLTAWGYFYTAVQFTWRMQSTLGLILLLILVHALARRWLLIARRRLAIEQARQRRAALSETKDVAGSSGEIPPVEPEQADLSVVNVQTRKLLQSVIALALGAGLYLIWVDVLPALGILNQRELWSVSVIDTLVDSSGAAQQKIERIKPVTWGNGALALVAIVMTVLATRNIPGLLEITILQRLPLEPGGRYAITTISRYLIILAGIVFTCGQLGLGWARVQWLAAAVTVGLGFGLQEIFANFVSGLIILFERPIRVGDTITIGDMTGSVSRIRIRATIITDGDRKELIVPNKEFITGKVLNWTLNDEMVRVAVTVGVGYDSDTDLVQRLILDVAHRQPGLLKEPAPTVFLEGFGDSALNFALRAFVPNLEHLGEIRHDLHTAINRKLQEANIEIPFPQRDIKIKSVPQLLAVAGAEAHPPAGNGVPAAHFTARHPERHDAQR